MASTVTVPLCIAIAVSVLALIALIDRLVSPAPWAGGCVAASVPAAPDGVSKATPFGH